MVTSQEKNNEKKDQLMIQESLWVELSQLNWGGSPSGFEKWTFTGWSDEDEDSSSENGIYTSTMAYLRDALKDKPVEQVIQDLAQTVDMYKEAISCPQSGYD